MGSNIVDDYDNYLVDFPPDNECGGDGDLVGSGDGRDFATWNDGLTDRDTFLSGSHVNSASDLSAELSVPYEDIVQLEWLSTFVEDSFSSIGLTLGKDNLCKNNESSANKSRTSSPVSVFGSSSSSPSSSAGKIMLPLSPNHHSPQRPRRKRPCKTTFNPRPETQIITPSTSSVETPHHPFAAVARGCSLESDHFTESLTKKIRSSPPKKIKITMPSARMPHDDNTVQAERKCLHCEITKTPQWRAGPMGPKTLCNACGVRYKSGRLFPEYRPAASPTFVPSLHSNSHKKVVEMRSKVGPVNEGPAQDTMSEDLEVAPDA